MAEPLLGIPFNWRLNVGWSVGLRRVFIQQALQSHVGWVPSFRRKIWQGLGTWNSDEQFLATQTIHFWPKTTREGGRGGRGHNSTLCPGTPEPSPKSSFSPYWSTKWGFRVHGSHFNQNLFHVAGKVKRI